MATSSGACLTIDLSALESNYRLLQTVAAGSEVAGVVKADGYGLGWRPVVETLWRVGCRRFFVARVDEGIVVRSLLPDAIVHVFDGVVPGTEQDLRDHRLVPVINTVEQLRRWQRVSLRSGSNVPLATALHVDTGMLRFGITPTDAKQLVGEPGRLEGLDLQLILSHLASADERSSDQAERQLKRFREVRAALPMGQASLANSAGLYRSPAFHLDVVRPGYAMFGGNPQPELNNPNPMTPVVSLHAPVLQIRQAEPGETVGYGATHTVERQARLATIGIGYADGFLRSGSNRGWVALDGQPVPIVGRVSMDLVTIDITDFEGDVGEGTMVEVIGPNRTLDDVAGDAGTIGYEILTSLGRRYRRRYLGDRQLETQQVET